MTRHSVEKCIIVCADVEIALYQDTLVDYRQIIRVGLIDNVAAHISICFTCIAA